MRDAGASRRYARALVDLAIAEGSEDAVLADLQAWDELFRGEGKALFHALCAPVFSTAERRAVLAAVAEKRGAQRLVARFLNLLVARDRVAAFPEILLHATDALDARANRLRVQVRSADLLSPALQAELAAAFESATGKTVLLDTSVDPSLLGGLVARLGAKVYDASLRTRLAEIKHRLIHAQPPAEA